ncbi:MAG: hypothetical protein M1817_006251 [Caeruleum heppii]|nr:MAG: hypothetical protein M1817_006251 [Caeruleum heppii]
MTYFSLPLRPGRQRTSVRASLYGSKKKKSGSQTKPDVLTDEQEFLHDARSQHDDDDDDDLAHITSHHSSRLSPDTAEQYRVAGLDPSRSLPEHFPHRGLPRNPSSRAGAGDSSLTTTHKQLARLQPPLFVPDASLRPDATKLRRRHLCVLVTILHRCLLEGDYLRAGRAWGLLLRGDGQGVIDLRSNGTWGIGAEILLRRGTQFTTPGDPPAEDVPSDSDIDDEGESPHHHPAPPPRQFSKAGFELARAYYESLILHFPANKHRPHATSSLDFYPAMFGLWIHSAQEERLAAERDLQTYTSPGLDFDMTGERARSRDAQIEGADEQHARIRREELGEAERILARMEELMISPPYADEPGLCRLREMVRKWIEDLTEMVPGEDEEG